ncbi:MAG: zinc-ribbon domain-containing protein [Solirubrobacteraceae bacterium]
MTEPAADSELGSAVTQPIPVVAEPCPQCGSPLAPDQRYCLHCGAPRVHVSGPISSGRADLASLSHTPGAAGPQVPVAGPGRPPGAPLPSAHPTGRNNTLALLAGIGVLLLAMGVGVLIGRAGAGSTKVPPAQVISVGGSSGGAATTPTTSTPSTETPAATTPKKKEAPKARGSSAPGSSINKPAPPSSAKNLRSGGSGQSYEQRSKNLPNVVGT